MPRLAPSGMPRIMTTKEHYNAQCKARAAEDQRLNAERRRLEAKTTTGYALWENKTADVIENNIVKRRVKLAKKNHNYTLESRRERLANLLKSEEQQYKAEIASTFETSAERRAKLKSKALALREERERHRQEFAQQAREMQWRNSCDALRTRDTMLTAKKIASYDRKVQLEMTEKIRKEVDEKERISANEYEKARLRRIEIEETKERKLAEENRKIKRMLDLQMEERREILEDEAMDRTAEAAALAYQWSEDQKREINNERVMAESAAKERAAVLEFNLSKRHEVETKRNEERDFDARLLKATLDREAAADANDKAEADARKRAMQEYQRHLSAQLIKEAEDTSKLEILRKEQLEGEWKKREDQWKREADARDRLMREVHAERQLQLKYKEERKLRETEEERRLGEALLGRVSKEDEMEQIKMGSLMREARAHQADLKSQILHKEANVATEKQQAYAEYLMMKSAEERYQGALEKLLQSSHEDKSFARKKNDWYS